MKNISETVQKISTRSLIELSENERIEFEEDLEKLDELIEILCSVKPADAKTEEKFEEKERAMKLKLFGGAENEL